MRHKVWMCLLTLLVIFVVSCAPQKEAAPSETVSEEAGAEACADSDDGNNVLVAGTTTKGDVSEKDYCSSADKVVEFYCKDGEVESALTPCPAGLECKDGVCAAKQAVAAKEPAKEVKGDQCVDSDGGKKYDVLGVTAKGSESKTDSCDGKNVVEYYCADNTVKSVTDACPQGQECKGGVCTALACVDSDDQNYFTAGKVTWNKLDNADFCNNKFELVERVCKNDALADVIYSCGEGYKCENAACVDSCFDSDGGAFDDVAGVVKKGAQNHSDFCLDSSQLKEYACFGESVTDFTYPTSQGYQCKKGAIVEYCTETDNGKDYLNAGNTNRGQIKASDVCSSELILNELYCSGSGNIGTEDVTCKDLGNYKCQSGACVAFCTDSDGGGINSPKVKGTVKVGDFTKSDYCEGGKQWEYSCNSNGTVGLAPNDCGGSYTCVDGTCQLKT